MATRLGSPSSPRAHDNRSAEQAEAERTLRDEESDRAFASKVLTRDINWQAYETNQFINKKELGLLLDYDKQNKEDQAALIEEKSVAYANLFIKTLKAIRDKETVEYLIVLIDQLIQSYPSIIPAFHSLANNNITNTQTNQNNNIPNTPNTNNASLSLSETDPFLPFLRLFSSPEQQYHSYVLNKTMIILSILLSTSPNNNSSLESSKIFLKYLISRLNTSSNIGRDHLFSLYSLKPLLQVERYQIIFIQLNGINALALLLSKENINSQLIYSIGFNLWLLSYQEISIKLISQSGCLKRLIQILKVQSMEKVIRIIISILRNLISFNENNINEELIGLGSLNLLQILAKRKFKDPDIQPDIDIILEILESTIKRLSSFDLYQSEIMSGALVWSPAHKNEIFWRENINLFEEKNYKIISKLIELLGDDEDLVREIACHDLGEFARFHIDGKRIINRLGGKNKLMVNLAHKNPKVAKAALLATQKLMVANWEFLAKSSQGGVAALVQKAGGTAKKE